MIVVRFKETFRDRAIEWALATGLLAWGALCITAPGLFYNSEFFFPLLRIMEQAWWGFAAVTLGAARLISLVINGAWRPTAHLRAIGCVFGSMLWGTLFTATLGLGWLTPTTAIYATVLGLDLLALWFAAGDAKLADIQARKKKTGV